MAALLLMRPLIQTSEFRYPSSTVIPFLPSFSQYLEALLNIDHEEFIVFLNGIGSGLYPVKIDTQGFQQIGGQVECGRHNELTIAEIVTDHGR